jgi:hypothetical protein
MSERKVRDREDALASYARRAPQFANMCEVIRPSVGGIVRARTRDLALQSN